MYRRILVPIDGSDAAARALREAAVLAAVGQARLVLLHVVVDLPWLLEELAGIDRRRLHRRLLEHGRRLLGGARRQLPDGTVAEAFLREPFNGGVAAAIAAEAAAQGCDLIVIGTHRHAGAHRTALGSHAASVALASEVPVLMVRSPQRAVRRLTQVKALVGAAAAATLRSFA